MGTLQDLLDDNEKIIWKGKPEFWPFILGRSFAFTIFGFFWTLITIVVLVFNYPLIPQEYRWTILLLPHLWFGIIALFGPTIYNYLAFKNYAYAITNNRLIIQKGVIGLDFEIIKIEQITDMDIEVGLFDKLVNPESGNIRVSTPSKNKSKLYSIKEPHETVKIIKKQK